MQTWSVTATVKKLRDFVKFEAERLESSPLNMRRARQLDDAVHFLRTLNLPQYRGTEKVAQLKKKFADNRQKLKEIYKSGDAFFPGYQLSIFDTYVDIDDRVKEELKFQREMLDQEIKWLHKCLGICHNKEYFR